MNKEQLKDFEEQVRIGLHEKIVTNQESEDAGIVITTDIPNERIWIRFYVPLYMFEKEYAIEKQTPKQIVSRFTYDLSEDMSKLF